MGNAIFPPRGAYDAADESSGVAGVERTLQPFLSEVLSRLLNWAGNILPYVLTLCCHADELEVKMERLWQLKEKVETTMGVLHASQVSRIEDWLRQVESLNNRVPGGPSSDSSVPGRVSRTVLLHTVYTLYCEGHNLSVPLRDIPDPRRTVNIISKDLPGTHRAVVGVRALLDQDVRAVVGIIGPRLVGKTTLLHAINNVLAEVPARHNAFGTMIWVTISNPLNIGKIQKEIGERLGLSLSEEGPMVAQADTLRRVLTRRRFLLLLDDILEPLDLMLIGIPPMHQSRGRILFATNHRHLCDRMLPNINWFKMDPLSEEESWTLFWESASERSHEQDVQADPHLNHLSKAALQKCGGIPTLIIHLAKLMGATTNVPEVWESTNLELASSSSDPCANLSEVSHNILEFHLMHFTVSERACFLYCSLFPCGHQIDEQQLVDYWIGEGFEDADSREIVHANAACHRRIDNLKENFFLFSSGSAVKKVYLPVHLHRLATKQHGNFRFIGLAARGLTTLEDLSTWSEAHRVSLMMNNITALPSPGECPILQTLFLNLNHNLTQFQHDGGPRNTPPSSSSSTVHCSLQTRSKYSTNNLIPESQPSSSSSPSSSSPPPPPSSISQRPFFACMSKLKVLDMSFTSIEELPSDVSQLTELRYLNMSNTKIRSLPTGVGNLHKLRQLDLSDTHCLREIPQDEISQLPLLEMLNLCGSSYAYHLSDHEGNESWNWLQNLGKLKRLGVTIKIQFTPATFLWKLHPVISRPPVFPLETRFLGLTDSPTCISRKIMLVDDSFRDVLVLKLFDIGLSTVEVSDWLPRLRRLHIKSCHQLRDIRWAQQLSTLEEIHVDDCRGMKNLLVGGQDCSIDRLREIEVRNLKNMETICSRPCLRLPCGKGAKCQFSVLGTYEVRNCPKLKEKNLQQLKITFSRAL